MTGAGWAGAALLGPGVLTYTGAVGATERHAHHAIQLMAASTELVVVDDGGCPYAGTRVAVPADTGHTIIGGAGAAVVVFVDPDAALGAAVNDRLGRSWTGGAWLDCIELTERDPRAVLAALTRALTPDLVRPRPNPRHPSVAAALEALPTMIGDGAVRTGDLARRLGISTSRLTHLFTDQVGLPLRRYVLWLRIMTAIARVAGGDDLTGAAHASGFADSAHLTRTCRATFGVVPSALSSSIAVDIDPADIDPAGIQPNRSIAPGTPSASLGPC